MRSCIKSIGAAGCSGGFHLGVFAVVCGAIAIAAGFPVAADAGPITNNLVFWVDADDLDGDGVAEGALESGLSGGLVTTWVDKAPDRGVNTTTQGTLANQPLFVLGGLNGRPVVRFDGLDDYLQSGLFTSALAQPTEMYIVWKADSNGSGGGGFPASIAVDGNTAGARQAITFENVAGADGLTMFAGFPGGAFVLQPYVFSAPIYMTAMFDDISSTIRVNGAATSPTHYPTMGSDAMGGVTLGGRYDLFGGDRLTLDGYIAELLIYSSPLSTTDRDAVESYLNGHWSIVPEPSALALLGLGGLMLLRRKR